MTATSVHPSARFYAILDTGYVKPENWHKKCRELLAGGADVIQLRAKNEAPDRREELLREILPLFEESTVPLIVNDDIDLSLRFPRLGLHVGQDDMPAREARDRLGDDRILGLSTHSIEQAREAIAMGPDVLSYFAVGPIFGTPTKPDYTPVGLKLARQVVELNPPLPFFCIGGITRGNIADVVAAGARRVVVVSDVLRAKDSAIAISELIASLPSM